MHPKKYQNVKNKRRIIKEQTRWHNRFRNFLLDIKRRSKLLGSGGTIMQYHYISKDDFGIGS